MRIKYLSLVAGFFIAFNSASAANVPVNLFLQPSIQDVTVGSQFTLDMNLSNTSSEQLGALNVFLTFDPTHLQVIDNGAGNWITTGINVLDGPYHNNFNWDTHIQNIADNTNGTISYGEASLFSNVFGNGTFAQITFLATAPVLNTPINYVITGTNGLNDTYVTDPSANPILAGTSGATVNVVPEPGSMMLMGMGLLFFIRKSARYSRQKMHKKSK